MVEIKCSTCKWGICTSRSCECSLIKNPNNCYGNKYRYWQAKPVITYKSNLLKHFPHADITQICRVEIYGGNDECFGDAKNCDECWNEEYCDEAKEA